MDMIPNDPVNMENESSPSSGGQTPAPALNSRPSLPVNRSSIAVACVACRSRHLKCDGGVPCSRCNVEGVSCSYVKSRRGWKGPRRQKALLGHDDGRITKSTAPSILANGISTSGRLSNSASIAQALEKGAGILYQEDISPPEINFNSPTTPRDLSVQAFGTASPQVYPDVKNAKTAFFTFFAPAHPILPPPQKTFELITEKQLTHLDLAIHFIGSFYVPSAPTQVYKDNLSRALLQQTLPRDGFTVQALLLFALGLHCSNGGEDTTAETYNSAISLALEIEMHRSEFAIRFGENNNFLEESWRRTWWELYSMNGMFAGVNPKIPFQLRDVVTDVPLPCEEKQFISGDIPQPQTLEALDDAPFAREEVVFSSFTYLIDAVRVLGKILAIDITDPNQLPDMDAAESGLTNWKLHLPEAKKDVVSRDGSVDEVLLRAHMVISAASIMLHRPRSTIGSMETQEITTCAPQGQHVLPTSTLEFHTAKAMQAANDLAKLITLPSTLSKRTPFLICALVMASVVHLSYWSFIVPDGEDASIKNLIKLDAGALKTFANVWPIAKTCLGQVQGVAHEMFTSKKAMSLHLWNTITGDEILQRLIEDAVVEQSPTQ